MATRKQIRPKTTWKEGRRLRAWELHQSGWTNVDIAAALGVSKVAVGQWVKATERGGLETLRSKSRQGQAARLSTSQIAMLPSLLDRGPEAFGFTGTYWTCGRIAEIIEREFDVHYHPTHVGRLLHHLDWSYHKPVVSAAQRDEEAITTWLDETWPAIKERAEKEGRTLVFIDEAAFYMSPIVTKTWAPIGQEVKLEGPLSRRHLSVIGGLTWEGSLYVQAQETSLGSEGVIRFLRHLLRHIPERLLVLWDGATIHSSQEMRDFLAMDTIGRLIHENFPPYAPEVDPQEYVWRQLKHVDFRNLTTYSLDQLWLHMRAATTRLRRRVGLLRNLVKHAGLE
jgi:transposase